MLVPPSRLNIENYLNITTQSLRFDYNFMVRVSESLALAQLPNLKVISK